jgi:sugar O-acyltransferase (sialic acid O-acetyltransferase NeuD family)
MPREQILIFGAGGHAKVVAEVARSLGLDVIGFIEDRSQHHGEPYFGARVIDWEHFLREHELWRLIPVGIAIGDNDGRADAYHRLAAAGLNIASLVHPSGIISPTATIGVGTVVMATAVVNADARIGEGVIINTAAVAEHDVQVGDFAHLSPNVALGGGARIGARAHVGLGAVVLPRVEVGAGSIIGAGAVVLRDVPPGITVAGVPARALHRL